MIRFAEVLLREAGNRIETAGRALRHKKYAYCFRQSQEAVELSLKGALRLKGVEYPKFHDVSEVLLRSSELFPSWFANKIPSFADASRRLVEKRDASLYGFEETKEKPGEAISKESAKAAFDNAQEIFKASKALFRKRIKRT